MRMWMVEPEIMCRQHLLGEHNELHMIAGHLRKKRRLGKFITNNCVEAKGIRGRHNELAKEMKRRGYNHKSPLPSFPIRYLDKKERNYKIDRKASLKDLLKRCAECGKGM